LSNEQTITITGRLANDPELRWTTAGNAIANFTVAYTPRRFDKNANEWRDGTTQWWRCQAWNAGKLTLAENIVNQLHKGDSVVLLGVVEAREYETKEGEKRTVTEVRVSHIGRDTLYHGQPHHQPAPQQDDPWGQPGQSASAPF
jgi:single-strand DNA-binding protein